MPKSKPFFSIVIPTLNEELYLPSLLQDLVDQTFTDFEIIHVDGNSEDQTVTLSQGFRTAVPLTILPVKKRQVSFQRNMGAAAAQGEWVIFMDADNRLPTFFLQGIKYQLERKPEVDVFTCWEDIAGNDLADRPVNYLVNLSLEMMSKVNPCAPGAMIGLKAALVAAYPFDETLTVSEDHDLVRRLVRDDHTFKVFREPRYIYSFRRYKKDGTLKTLRTYAKLQYSIIMGKKITEPLPDYPMLGGSLYAVDQVKTMSKPQLTKIREKLQSIIKFIEEY